MNDSKIIAIDPGNEESAFVIMDAETYKPIEFHKIDNEKLANILPLFIEGYKIETCIIESIASYGMPVGKSVFETCIYIGRLTQICIYNNVKYEYMPRQRVKLNLCNSVKAKDSNIRQALINRFGIVGTKKNQGFFYGFKADIWSAFAIGTTYLDKIKNYEYIPKF
jgi:hypothetical protein